MIMVKFLKNIGLKLTLFLQKFEAPFQFILILKTNMTKSCQNQFFT